MDSINQPQCCLCRFFVSGDALNGQCHRYPPAFAGESSPREAHHWRFPGVSGHSWCGEFATPDVADQIS